MDHHIAQFNIARALMPLDDPRMAGFVDRLDEINGLAEQTPGFVWRHMDESGNSTAVRPMDDPNMLINYTIWDSLEALFDFTYKSAHKELFAGRKEWFGRGDGPHLVLWWVLAGTIPSLDEAMARLAFLAAEGPTSYAFTFKQRFPAPVARTAAAG